MTNLPSSSVPVCARPRQPEKPAVAVHGSCRWVERPTSTADSPARQGRLLINGTEYLVLELLCPETVLPLGWTLVRPALGRRIDASSYDVLIHGDELLCDCPDATFRPSRPAGGCKHCKALCVALAALDRQPRHLCETCGDHGYVPVAVDEVEPCPDCCNLAS
jgi:hypothetical protein